MPTPISPSPRPSPPGSTASRTACRFEGIYTGDAYRDPKVREVPKSLYEAIALLEQSKIAREAFGDVVVDHYVNTARQEQMVYDRRVTDVDLLRNFERA